MKRYIGMRGKKNSKKFASGWDTLAHTEGSARAAFNSVGTWNVMDSQITDGSQKQFAHVKATHVRKRPVSKRNLVSQVIEFRPWLCVELQEAWSFFLLGINVRFPTPIPGGGFARLKTSVSDRSWKWTVFTNPDIKLLENKHIISRQKFFHLDLPHSVFKPGVSECVWPPLQSDGHAYKEREMRSPLQYSTLRRRRRRLRRFAGTDQLCSCDQKKKKICMQRRGKSDHGGWEFGSMHVALVAPEMGRIIGCHGNWLQTRLIKCGYN